VSTVAIKLPKAALTALARRARERATLVLVAVNADGTRRATITIAHLTTKR